MQPTLVRRRRHDDDDRYGDHGGDPFSSPPLAPLASALMMWASSTTPVFEGSWRCRLPTPRDPFILVRVDQDAVFEASSTQ